MMLNLSLLFKCIYIYVNACMLSCFSSVRLFATLWTAAHQAPLSMEFPRQEYWSGLPCPPRGDLPHPGIEPSSLKSPHWQVGSLPLVPPGKPHLICTLSLKKSLQIKKTKKQQQQNKTWTCEETCILNYSSLLKPPRWCTRNLKFHLSFVSFVILGCVKKREE